MKQHCFNYNNLKCKMSVSIVDEKLEKYREIQSDIQKLFLSKQQYLSQFNENTLVKGVRNTFKKKLKKKKLLSLYFYFNLLFSLFSFLYHSQFLHFLFFFLSPSLSLFTSTSPSYSPFPHHSLTPTLYFNSIF